MAEQTGEPPLAGVAPLALRALLAAGAVACFLLLRAQLDPRALVAARFGVGVVLFALLVDAGRILVGSTPPVQGPLSPHRQRAEPLVDEGYKRVHEPVKRFVDEGVWTRSYEALLAEVFASRDVDPVKRDAAIDRARQAARDPRPSGVPLAMALIAGALVVGGLTVVVGILLEALAMPVTSGLFLASGLGLALLQVRAHDAGHRWTGLALGLGGAALVVIAGLRLGVRSPGPWWLVHVLAAGLALGSIALAVTAPGRRPPWSSLEDELVERFSTLRRAFLAALLAGGVLFPFKPLLEELFEALSWPLGVPYQLATVGYATLVGYLAIEMTGVWYGLSRGRERARAQRRRRVQANQAILELVEPDRSAAALEEGPSA